MCLVEMRILHNQAASVSPSGGKVFAKIAMGYQNTFHVSPPNITGSRPTQKDMAVY